MINKIREIYPQANITPIDYDPSATRVNQENRIKLMIAVARERLRRRPPARMCLSPPIRGPRQSPMSRPRCDRILCKTCWRGGPSGSASLFLLLLPELVP